MYTRHAELRCRQRGISREVVDVILTYGQRMRSHGADVCFMDRAARKELERELGHDFYRRVADRLNIYVVANDDLIVTAAPRRRRLRRCL